MGGSRKLIYFNFVIQRTEFFSYHLNDTVVVFSFGCCCYRYVGESMFLLLYTLAYWQGIYRYKCHNYNLIWNSFSNNITTSLCPIHLILVKYYMHWTCLFFGLSMGKDIICLIILNYMHRTCLFLVFLLTLHCWLSYRYDHIHEVLISYFSLILIYDSLISYWHCCLNRWYHNYPAQLHYLHIIIRYLSVELSSSWLLWKMLECMVIYTFSCYA